METKKYKYLEVTRMQTLTKSGKTITIERLENSHIWDVLYYVVGHNYVNVGKMIGDLYSNEELYRRQLVRGEKWIYSDLKKYADVIVLKSEYGREIAYAFKEEKKDKIYNILKKQRDERMKAHKEYKKEKKEQQKEYEKERALEERKDDLMRKWTGNSVAGCIISCVRTGAHNGSYNLNTGCTDNDFICTVDYEQYCRSCQFTKSVYSFTIHVKKGWSVHNVAGVMTFIPGTKIDRKGVRCEWIEEGRGIGNYRKVKGYLVRGEHIEAKSLTAAKKISVRHRTETMNNLLKLRRKQNAKLAATMQQYKEFDEKIGRMITFEDSLAAGNCNAGTTNFKNRVEDYLQHEVTGLRCADLMKYAKMFHVESNAVRIINMLKAKYIEL